MFNWKPPFIRFQEADRRIYTHLDSSLPLANRSSDGRENISKLAELNILKNSLKLTFSPPVKPARKSTSKRKAKRNKNSWAEGGERAIFYSGLCTHGDYEVTKKAKSNSNQRRSDSYFDEIEEGSPCNVDGGCCDATVKLSTVSGSQCNAKNKYSRGIGNENEAVVRPSTRTASTEMRSRSNANGNSLEAYSKPGTNVDLPEVSNDYSEVNAKQSKMDEVKMAVASDYYKSVVKEKRREREGDQSGKADIRDCKPAVESFPRIGMNSSGTNGDCYSPRTKPSAKVKPYTVVDLSTMSTLTPEEVETCLKEVTDAEKKGQKVSEEERPRAAVLPPKTKRPRSNTTAGLKRNEEGGEKLSEDDEHVTVNGEFKDFAPLKIMSVDDDSDSGRPCTVELSSFRCRAKSAPSRKEQSKLILEGLLTHALFGFSSKSQASFSNSCSRIRKTYSLTGLPFARIISLFSAILLHRKDSF